MVSLANGAEVPAVALICKLRRRFHFEIPFPGCVAPGSPFAAGIANALGAFDVRTRLRQFSLRLLDLRIPTDIEQFWDHYQNQTLPRVYKATPSALAQYRTCAKPGAK